jgi:hypothetical protein
MPDAAAFESARKENLPAFHPRPDASSSKEELAFAAERIQALVHLGMFKESRFQGKSKSTSNNPETKEALKIAIESLRKAGVPKADIARAVGTAPRNAPSAPALVPCFKALKEPLDDARIRELCRQPGRPAGDLWEFLPRASAPALRLQLACGALSGRPWEAGGGEPEESGSPGTNRPRVSTRLGPYSINHVPNQAAAAISPEQWLEIARMLSTQPKWRIHDGEKNLAISYALLRGGNTTPDDHLKLAKLPLDDFLKLVFNYWVMPPRGNPLEEQWRKLVIAIAEQQKPGASSWKIASILGFIGPGGETQRFRKAVAPHLAFLKPPFGANVARSLARAGLAGKVLEIASPPPDPGTLAEKELFPIALIAEGLWMGGCPEEAWKLLEPVADQIMKIGDFANRQAFAAILPIARDANQAEARKNFPLNGFNLGVHIFQPHLHLVIKCQTEGKIQGQFSGVNCLNDGPIVPVVSGGRVCKNEILFVRVFFQ